MIIRNFDQLAVTPLRRQALLIAEAGLMAIAPKKIVKRYISYDKDSGVLIVRGQKFSTKQYKRIVLVGAGKTALSAVSELHGLLGDRVDCGYVIDLTQGHLEKMICRVGTHPYPSVTNIAATEELMSMLDACTEDDLVMAVIGGGGSSLLCSPNELTCDEEKSIFTALSKAGASIFELNTVRKHISRVKGGQLAKICYPATVISLIFSDVPGNDLGMVASGPTVKDETTVHEASEILRRYDILKICNLPVCNLVETPKEQKYFESVSNLLVCSAKDALVGMQEKARDLGWRLRIWKEGYEGEARVVGPAILAAAKTGECLLASGESTVKVIGSGQGGRNQELALSVVPVIGDKEVLVAIASDGYDDSESAGAIVDSTTRASAARCGLAPEQYLDDNDSFTFFSQAGGGLDIGLTGSNVSDFVVCLKQ